MFEVKPAKDLKAMRRDDQIWSIAMMIRDLASFEDTYDGPISIMTIHYLNVGEGYNNIVVPEPELGKPLVISRTSSVDGSVKGIIEIEAERARSINVYDVIDLIYVLADLLKEMTSN